MSPTNPEKDGFWMFGISFLGSPSSELFLALSGTVLLPVKTGFREFYKRRFTKLLPPLIIWSVLGIVLYTFTRNLSYSDAFGLILRIPLQPAVGVYWFVYAMAGLYLFAPFISYWLRNSTKRQIEFFLGLWIINMVFPWLLYLFPNLTEQFVTNGNYYWPLVYFGGFLGYWLLGYYLKKYPIQLSLNFRWIALCVLTLIYPVVVIAVKLKGGGDEIVFNNLQIGSVLAVAFLYTIMQNIRFNDRVQSMLTSIAKYSFCIYLTHIYIARELYWSIFEGSSIHIFPRTFLIAFLTLITGYLLTGLLGFLPKSKYITGA